jgi:glycopeptide antibiotics resistance protein
MLRHLLYPFLPYRSFVVPILAVSSIVVPCWLLFRWYRLRASDRDLSFQRELLLLIFVAYLSGVAAVTLLPNHSSRQVAETMVGIQLRPNLASLTCASGTLREGSTARAFCLHNAKGNLALFFPLGFLIPLIWTRLRFWRGIQIAVALSVGIELLQFFSRAWGSNRSADVNDVVLNVLGASLGLALVTLLRTRRSTRPAVLRA